jgi:hypothetical protein
MKHFGSIEDLKSVVSGCDVQGRWFWREDHRFHCFRAPTGEALNWWPKTGTLVIQGSPNAELQAALADKASPRQHRLL